jgi:bisphosphoglycerate-dependent phosphoglycerate mutase
MNWKFTRERNHKKELVRNTGFEHCNQWNKKYNQKPPKKTKNIISDIGYWSIELNQSKKKKKRKEKNEEGLQDTWKALIQVNIHIS